MNREIKDSGIKWVGKVPRNWKIHRFKNILQNRNLKNKPKVTDTILSLTKDRGVIPYSEKGDVGNRSKEDITKYNLAFPEDIVMNSMNVIIGSVNISKYTGAVSPVYYVFYPKNKNINIYFYNMLFQTREFQNSLKGIGNGILEHRMRIPLNKLNNIRLPLPEYKEQLKIVDFLDKAIININNIITQTYHSIEELKKYKQSLITESVTKGLDPNAEMKDSGIEWIGKIPKYWQTIKMKYLLSTPLLYGANESGIPYQEDLPRYIRITDILNNNKLTDNNKLSLSLEKAKSFFLKENDILFARSGASVGKTFLISKENVNDTFAGYLIKASFKDNVNAKYIFLFTQSSAFENWKNAITIQSTIQNIGANRYNNLIISLPTYEEQQQIVQYLDKKIFTIDSLIEDKTKFIEELENYKKSLIYEYVTGKKEV